MKIMINEDYIRKVIEAYRRLGFNFSEEDLCDLSKDYNDIRVSYVFAGDTTCETKLNEIDLVDLNAAYMNANNNAETKKDVLLNNIAFKTLFNYIKDEDKKIKVNKKLFNYIIDHPEVETTDNIEDIVVDDDKQIDNLDNNDNIKKEYIKKVVNVEENEKVAKKARKNTDSESIAVLAGIIILCGAVGFAAVNYSKNNKKENDKEIVTEDNTNIDNDIEIESSVMTVVNTDNTPEVQTNTETEEITEEATEEVQEQIDVHSDEFINNVADKITNNIQLDQNLAYKYDRDLVEALVRYTHHNYEEYTGDSILSNEAAYEDLSELIRHGYDISVFYEGLNNYENLNALYIATKDLKQEKGQYEDEFKIYMCMDIVMNDMNQNNFAEAVALRAYVDNYSVIPSMQMARQQAGVLEMKDTQDLWRDVNKDGKITYEENAEGKGYEEEKARAMAAKYGEMSSEKCAQIYNRISTDNHNSELSQIVYRALDEDDARARTR